jgi:hypothetical protein
LRDIADRNTALNPDQAFCVQCGAALNPEQIVCIKCGAAIAAVVSASATDSSAIGCSSAIGWLAPIYTSGWAVIAGYAGLLSVILFPAPIAFMLGIIALWDCKRRSVPGTGRAIFAIVMGTIFSFILLCLLAGMTLGF